MEPRLYTRVTEHFSTPPLNETSVLLGQTTWSGTLPVTRRSAALSANAEVERNAPVIRTMHAANVLLVFMEFP